MDKDTHAELDHIHDTMRALFDRVDETYKGVSALHGRMEAMESTCRLCRPVVFGNGVRPIAERVALLEACHQSARQRNAVWISIGALGISALHLLATSLNLFR